MTPRARGLLVALLHVTLVASLGGKLLYDRATLPRVWARTRPVDPQDVFRGRYVQLGLLVEAEGSSFSSADSTGPVRLYPKDGRLVAEPAPQGSSVWVMQASVAGSPRLTLSKPVAFFIPENVQDPSFRQPGEELWVEVTVPPTGLPRPIRLGLKVGEGAVVPLSLRSN